MTTPLTIPCPHCEDGIVYVSRYGGDDPDIWRVGKCEECGGVGTEPLFCDGCRAEAVEWFQGYAWCASCLAEQKADALVMGEN